MTDPEATLAAVAAAAAVELAPPTLEALAASLAHHPGPTLAARTQASRAAPGNIAGTHLSAICAAWVAFESPLPGSDVARCLRSAAAAAAVLRDRQRLDIVWTGPASYQVPVCPTASTLIDLIDWSRRELLVVAFATYRVAAVLAALDRAARRGVKITMLLETAEDSAGKLSYDAADAFSALSDRIGLWVWPARNRPKLAAGHAAMHAKAAVADRQRALVGSANLTGHALEANMELGILVEGGPVPERVAAHFSTLMADGVLVRLDAS